MNTSLVKLESIEVEEEFYYIIEDLINNETVKQMKNYRQHYETSTYEHCLSVAYTSYKICKKLRLDYISAARAGMLHDLFLYDWRNSKKKLDLEGYHAFVHPKLALKNASKLFHLNNKEKDIIVKHMWPVTIQFPRYLESYIVSLADKYSTVQESIVFYDYNLKKKRTYKYAYIFLSSLIMV